MSLVTWALPRRQWADPTSWSATRWVGWSRWSFQLPDGTAKKGVSVYRFKGDKILRQYDYIGTDQL